MAVAAIAKIGHCNECPAFETGKGRCVATGPATCDVYVLGSAPGLYMENYGYTGFSGDAGQMYKSIMATVRNSNPVHMRLKAKYHHAAHCFDPKMNTDIIHHCATLVRNDIYNSRPKVILALGAEAMKALAIKGTVSEMRGQELTVSIGNRDIPVIVSFSPGALIRKENAGKIPTVKGDILMAMRVATNGLTVRKTLEELTKDYTLCKTPTEFKKLVDMVLTYPADLPNGEQGPAESNLLALDTETAVEGNKYSAINTWVPGFKMIAISVSWAHGKSAAILLNHRLNTFKYEDYKVDIERLCNSPNPKAFHNYKYDRKVLVCSEGYTLNNVMFDSQMGEFLLDENKKGEYGLKKITKNRVPEFYGYENMLHNPELAAKSFIEETKVVIKQKALDIKDIRADNKYYRDELTVLNKAIKEGGKAAKEELQPQKDEVNTKLDAGKEKLLLEVAANKSRKAAVKDKKDTLDDLKDMSFEDYEVDTMLLYAAIDTDITRRISKQQIAEIKKDSVKLFSVMTKHMLPAAEMFAEMEHVGVKIDLEYVEELAAHFDKFIKETDSVALFIDADSYESCEFSKTRLSDLYGEYKEFCNEDGYKSLGKSNFAKRLMALGYKRIKADGNKDHFLLKQVYRD